MSSIFVTHGSKQRGRGRFTGGLPPGGGDPNAIALHFYRKKGSDGTSRANMGIPLLEGAVTSSADVANAAVFVNGSEVQAYVEGLGRHPDGSYRTLLIQCDVTISSGTPVAGQLVLNTTPAQARLTKTAQVYSVNRNDPRLAGYPDVMAWPDSADYLVACNLNGPAITVAQGMALGGQYDVYEKRFLDNQEWWWTPNAGVGTYGTALAQDAPQCFGNCHIGNTNYNGADLSDPEPNNTYFNWRNAVAVVGSAGHNYYDAGLIWTTWGCRLGGEEGMEVVRRGLAFSWHYMDQYLALLSPQYSVDGFRVAVEGCGAHYLLTGAEIGKDAVEGMANRFFVQVPGYTTGTTRFGYGAAVTDPANTVVGKDGRETGRALLTALVARRIGSTALDYDAKATLVVDLVLGATGANAALRTDGSYRNVRCANSSPGDLSGLFDNTFMHTILADALIKYYEEQSPDVRIPPAVKGMLDYLYASEWQLLGSSSVKSFRNDFADTSQNPQVHNCGNTNDAVDLTLMYPHLWSWYASVSGDATYRTKADEIFDAGVGTAMDGTNGPAIHGTFTSAQKIMREAHCFSWRHLAYRAA